MKHLSDQLTRRRFLGEMNCAAIGSTSILSSLLNLQLSGRLAAQTSSDEDEEYRALVCVFLSGGNDSFNMLTPFSGDARTAYEDSRGEIALPQSDYNLLPDPLSDGRQLGLHKNMSEVFDLYNAGKASLICNVGSLIEPTDLNALNLGTAKLPLGLYSHADQAAHWQSTTPEQRNARTGWGGRLADLMSELNGDSGVSMNISVAGRNLYQVGDTTAAFTIGTDGVPSMSEWNQASYLPRRTALESIIDQEYQSALERTFAGSKKQAIQVGNEFSTAYEGAEPLNTAFDSANGYAEQLRSVARSIAARDLLGHKRQTFFVLRGGWDSHGSLAGHPSLLGDLSQGIGQFQVAMAELGLEDKVTLFTASDFGRTLSPNAAGSDHAWGGNQIVVGGAVQRGIYGDYPDLALGNNLDTGRGRLIPTTSVDEYYAELALWLGVNPTDMAYVLPNLHRFHDISGGVAPLGFMP